MKKKQFVLFLITCLTLCLSLCLGVAAEDGAEASPHMSTGAIVSLAIGAALIVALVVFCIVKREKVGASLRAYRSEMRKITWYPWKSVWRGTIFVIVAVVAVALVVGLLDVAFFELQYMLTGKGLHFFG